MSKTRKVFQPIPGTTGGLTGVHSGQVGGRWIDQTATPWCIRHNNSANQSGCYKVEGGNTVGHCVISTGGPDHKWWKDK